jgi:hypothetical protein
MNETLTTPEKMDWLRRKAATVRHNLDSSQLSGTLSEAAALRMRDYLNRCDDLEPGTAPAPPGAAVPPPMSAFQHIPPGRYATPSLTGNNDFDFWQVDRPDKGKWAGRTFIERIIGGQENARLGNMHQRAAAQAIADYGIDEASYLFGQQLGICGDCGRHLTDEESRRIGKGPVCRNKGR